MDITMSDIFQYCRIFVLLRWPYATVNALDISVSSSEFELEVDKFGIKLFVVNPLTKQRLPNFSAVAQLERLIEFTSSTDPFQNPISAHNFSTRAYTTRSYNKTETSTLVRVIDQTTIFPNGVNFTLRVETFNSTLNRSYFGWKQRLNPQNIKLTYILEGVDKTSPSYRPSRSYQIGVFFSITVELQVDPLAKLTNPYVANGTVSSCEYTDPEPTPLIYCGDVKFNESLVPGLPGVASARYSQLEILERRGRLRIVQQRDTTCVSATGRSFATLKTARFEHPELDQFQSYIRIVSDIVSLYNTPDYYGKVGFPGLIAFAPDECNATAFEYDPDFASIFSFVEPPASNPAEFAAQAANNLVGAIVGGVVGGIAGVAIIVVLALVVVSPSFRHRISPFERRTNEKVHHDEIDLAEESSPSPDASKRWTRAAVPE